MKFSIRDVLLATVIAALILGWLIDRTRLASQLQATGSDDLQFVVAGEKHNDFYLVNPRTGEVWHRYDNKGKWLQHTLPLEK
jgi:hypothetical protein